ncbi:GntR family transcriptional regulator [Paraburkholderia xenovorans]
MIQIQNVEQKIRHDIVTGSLPFGSRVTIASLAEKYGVSQMPIREALRALHGEGLLTIEPNRGARIRKVDREFVNNLFDIRGALEVILFRKMVTRATRADIAALRDIEERFEASIAQGEYETALSVNREFHTKINDTAGNPDAAALLDRQWLLVAALWHRFDFGPERFAGEVNDHHHMIEAVARQDVEGAATLMGAHVVKARHTLLALMDRNERQQKGGSVGESTVEHAWRRPTPRQKTPA